MNHAWLILSSLRTTAVLAIGMALLAGVAAWVPQGWPAVEIARLDHAQQLQQMAAWGMTEVFSSPWLHAVGVLLLANVFAVLIRWRFTRPEDARLDVPPAGAPLSAHLEARVPERAVESLRETFRHVLGGAPVHENVEGSRVTMVFETGRSADLAPLLTHLGLVALVVGAGLSITPAPRLKSVVHAVLNVQDSRTGTVGTFDMASGEPFKFFQWDANYMIRDYVVDRGGLGPAIRMEQIFTEHPERNREFWVYQNAPAGFDEKHRGDVVYIEAKRMGIAPLPGAGLASKPESFLMVLGLGMLCFGALVGHRPRGLLWLSADGDEVEITGVPHHAEDETFAGGFARWAVLARAVLEP